jgi:hypothetical protein
VNVEISLRAWQQAQEMLRRRLLPRLLPAAQKCGGMICRVRSQPFYTWKNRTKTWSQDAFFGLFATVAVIGFGAYAAIGSMAYCGEDRLSMKELVSVLGELVKAPRAKLNAQKRAAPMFTIHTIKYDGRIQSGKVADTHVLNIKFKPEECNIIKLVNTWLPSFGDPEGLVSDHLKRLKDFYRDPKATTLAIIAKSESASMNISKFCSDGDDKVSISLYQDGGFTIRQLEDIAQGYAEGFSAPKSNDKQLEFKLNPSFFDGDTEILKGLRPLFSNREQERLRDQMDENSSNATNATNDPIEELKKMGVEVFDKHNNAEMSWDQLAGYKEVKQQIQETVVLALQYPEVYDQVAKHTRVYFESNRPKAVLLEGPPGTGMPPSLQLASPISI